MKHLMLAFHEALHVGISQ